MTLSQRFRFAIVPACVVLGLLAGVDGPVRAQTSAAPAVFDNSVLHEVRLFINTRDLRQLRERYLESFYLPADFIWGGTRVRNVGVRVHGAGSRNPVKLGLDVVFDRYTKGQTFQGLNGVMLDNLWQDPSLVRENLAMSVYRRLGFAAPRESFAKVYINNEYQGLYGLVELVDNRFAAEATGDADGRLFEYRYLVPFFGEDLGDDLSPYKQLFESRTDSTNTDHMLYGPIRELFLRANAFEDPAWRERLEAYLDLAQILAHTAVQGCIANIDGITGYAGMNNFYLHRAAAGTRHRTFPWDEDVAFGAVDTSIMRSGDKPVAFIERARQEPDLRAYFLDVAEACARTLMDEDWLANEIERLAALVTPAALEDTKKQFSNEAFATELDFLRGFAANRSALVLAEVAALR